MSEYNNEKQAGDEKVERIRQPKSKTPLIVIAIIIFIAVVVLLNSMVVTKENEYTLIKQFGKVERIVPNAGLSFRIPFIQTTDTLPKTMLLYDLTASDVITQDKKTMVVDSYVLWRITDPLKFTQTLTNITNAEGRINTIVYNSMKNIISSMSQSEVISSRDGALSQSIMQNIGTSVEQYGIRFVSIETKHLERMISERNNIAASYTANGESEAKMIRTKTDNEIVVSVSEAEAQAEKIIAEGEAEYMKILSEAYNTPDRAEFYTFVRALDAAKKSMKGDKTLILPKDSPLAELFVKVE